MYTMSMRQYPVTPQVAMTVIIACLAANIALGFVVRRVGLPIYLDTVGTILATIMLGWRWGLVAAALSVALGSILIWPQYFWYSMTAVGIVVAVEMCWRFSLYRSPLRVAWAGLIIAAVAAILSAPITAHFSAMTYSGNDLITAFFRQMGNSLMKSVLFSGFSSEPVDKVVTSLIVYYALSGFPEYLMKRYHLRGIN